MSHRQLPSLSALLLITASSLITSHSATAAKLGDIEFTDSVEVDGTTLQLNGLGWRLATFFSVKVYAMGLYLSEKTDDASAIIASNGNKKIIMRLVRDVSASKLSDAWQEGFENNIEDVGAVQAGLDQFKSAMRDVTEGMTMTIDFSGETTTLAFDGETVLTIEGADFQKGLLSVWLGQEPPNSEIKEGILGHSE